jgi:hypothetical protein
VGTAVVRRSNGSETLLSSGIPNLQFDRLGVELNGADFLRIKRDGNAKSEKS